ncbi:MAG: bifunctional 5,10-methylenetetrahydrofolate dehydrogenase/5,10-methenyltetrahydrofolate cyclohydrolase, partial [Alphaproteobacteria bacterium]
ILPTKDVDGFNPYNTGMLQNNEKPYFIAATPLGIMRLIHKVCPELTGKNVVIIGASLIVGRPLATLLLNQECTVTVTHIHTRDIEKLARNADILVAACGVAKLVKSNWIKDGSILIDVGINRDNGHICGDIDFEDVKEIASAITPVPGGVGPMTVAMLLQNTVEAYIIQNQSL